MTLREIVTMLNDYAENENFKFKDLQLIRQKATGRRQPSYAPFKKNEKRESQGYTFHEGGRREIQFNIGKDLKDNIEIFRYGLAFSLETGQDLPNPLEVLEEKIDRFNAYIESNYEHIANYKMWYYDIQGNKIEFESVKKIDNSMKINGYFIFIGKYFKKSINEINENDAGEILSTFDDLLPVYEFVENFKNLDKNEYKISRICWNTNGWVKPSGRLGKAQNPSHEKEYGFGHEEWLLDTGKLIDGYHYAFLEPIQKFPHKYEGKIFNILLYTIDSKTKNKFWVGWLKNVEVIDRSLAKQVIRIYRKNGWLDEMKSDLDSVGLNGSNIINEYLSEINLFNIRFKAKEVGGIFEDMILIDKKDKLISSTRYVLLDVSISGIGENIAISSKNYDFNSGNDGKTSLNRKGHKKTEKSDVEIELKHNLISDSLIKLLKSQYGDVNVKRECSGNGGGQIDMVVRTDKGDIFYEIKTYNHLKTSMRNAIGQMLEYATFPDKMDAIKLYLVSDIEPDKDFEKYIKHLNKIVKIPIGYIQYNTENNGIVKQI